MTDSKAIFSRINCEQFPATNFDPGQRVNYVKGQILGVNEFIQEQVYFLAKEYQHNRALHGYGVVWGLEVTARIKGQEQEEGAEDKGGSRSHTKNRLEVPQGQAGNVELVIKKGVAIDQYGRVFQITDEELCADLSQWIRTNQPARDEGNAPQRTLYIRARYDEYCDDRRLIIGEPCSTNGENKAYWRIQDHYFLELSWEAPSMHGWDYARRFAEVMAHIRVVPDGNRAEQTTVQIVELLKTYVQNDIPERSNEPRTLNDALDALEAMGEPRYFALEMSYASEVFHILYDLYNTYAMTRAAEDSINNPDIVLAEMVFSYTGGDNEDPVQLASVEILEDQRPVLLNTQSLQAVEIFEDFAGVRVFEFASLQAVNNNTALLWLHTPFPALPQDLSEDENRLVLFINDQRATGRLQQISEIPAVPGDNRARRVYLLQDLATTAVGGTDPAPLSDTSRMEMQFAVQSLWADTNPTEFESFLGYDPTNEILTIYATSHVQSPLLERPFAAVTVQGDPRNGSLKFKVGFNVDNALIVPEDAILVQIQGDTLGTRATKITNVLNSRELWEITPKSQNRLREGASVTLFFNLVMITHTQGGISLKSWMQQNGFVFEHYDGGDYVALPIILSPFTSHTEIEAIANTRITSQINSLMMLPLASIRPLPGNTTTSSTFEIWFHLNAAPDGRFVQFIGNAGWLRVYSEAPGGPVRVADANLSIVLAEPLRQLYTVTVNVPVNDEEEPEYLLEFLRFVFAPGAMEMGRSNLQAEINSGQYRFEGYSPSANNGGPVIVIYVRNVVSVG
ncbi:MAG: hypothetical protein OHK0046_41780 [Anaerolineae bacterium]